MCACILFLAENSNFERWRLLVPGKSKIFMMMIFFKVNLRNSSETNRLKIYKKLVRFSLFKVKAKFFVIFVVRLVRFNKLDIFRWKHQISFLEIRISDVQLVVMNKKQLFCRLCWEMLCLNLAEDSNFIKYQSEHQPL